MELQSFWSKITTLIHKIVALNFKHLFSSSYYVFCKSCNVSSNVWGIFTVNSQINLRSFYDLYLHLAHQCLPRNLGTLAEHIAKLEHLLAKFWFFPNCDCQHQKAVIIDGFEVNSLLLVSNKITNLQVSWCDQTKVDCCTGYTQVQCKRDPSNIISRINYLD